jgi:hypothetical protein
MDMSSIAIQAQLALLLRDRPPGTTADLTDHSVSSRAATRWCRYYSDVPNGRGHSKSKPLASQRPATIEKSRLLQAPRRDIASTSSVKRAIIAFAIMHTEENACPRLNKFRRELGSCNYRPSP